MQAPVQPEEDRSGGFKYEGWSSEYFDEVMAQVSMRLLINVRYGGRADKLF